MSELSHDPHHDRNPLERFLSLFTGVRGGEGGTVLLLAANVFLILTAYYIIKPVREALLLSYEGGAELKSYTSAAQAILLIGVVSIYGWLASTVSRRRLLNTVNLFFMLNLGLFWVASFWYGDSPRLGVVFYVWVGIFNLMVPAMFWSFANDLYTTEQGKRLFVIVAFGASMGAIAGGVVTDLLEGVVGVYPLLLVSALTLGLALVITNVVDRREADADSTLPLLERDEDEVVSGGRFDAFALVMRSRYLLLLALLMLFLNWVNTTGEYILGRVVEDIARTEAASRATADASVESIARSIVTDFYAGFYTTVNVVTVLIQLLLVSRIIKYAGIPRAVLVLPVISLLGYSFMAFIPVLAIIRVAKIAENATDYSLQNTVRQALFLPTTREEKYKAKQAIDTFFQRAGDVASASLVAVGVNLLAWSTQAFALFNLGLVVVWLLIAWRIGRRYRVLTRAT